ncbi:MAG: hypothetical protein LBT45_03655 [Rickettsiales bacterium]|jgi:hypothetical protein|nr:hypothetical protein [Rickettsiales bacterium]
MNCAISETASKATISTKKTENNNHYVTIELLCGEIANNASDKTLRNLEQIVDDKPVSATIVKKDVSEKMSSNPRMHSLTVNYKLLSGECDRCSNGNGFKDCPSAFIQGLYYTITTSTK